jgi:hypothetical protein
MNKRKEQNIQKHTPQIVMAHPVPACSFRSALRPQIKQVIAVRSSQSNHSIIELKPDSAPCLSHIVYVFSYSSSPLLCGINAYLPSHIFIVACVRFCHLPLLGYPSTATTNELHLSFIYCRQSTRMRYGVLEQLQGEM